MEKQERILRVVYAAIDDFNEIQPPDRKFVKALDTMLFDPLGRIDSLGLTVFLVAIEQKVEAEFGSGVSLLSERSAMDMDSPLRSVRALTDHIAAQLESAANG